MRFQSSSRINREAEGPKKSPTSASLSNRDRVLEAACELFAETGFHGTHLREICKHAGTNVAGVCYHFQSKEGLYQAVMMEAGRQLSDFDRNFTSSTQLPPEERLLALTESLLRRLGSKRAWIAKLLARELVDHADNARSHAASRLERDFVLLQAVMRDLPGTDSHSDVIRLHALTLIPLQQVSIASLIIALGMLVDVPVVASDGINRELHKGEPLLRAAWLGPLHLRHPMVFGTLINVFAFLPLLLLSGDKGEFMKSLPIVITISLFAALLVSVTFTPLVSYYVLRGQKGFDEGGEVRSFFLFRYVDKTLMAVLPHYRCALEKSLRRPFLVLGIGYSVLAASCLLVPFLGSQFFPPAERNQFLVDIELPSSDSLTSMRTTVDQAVTLIKSHEEVLSAAVFTGGTAPRFYYNVEPKEPANYLAQILINTRNADDITGLLVKLRQELDKSVPGARCVVKQLEQGPPVAEPIQIRISGENLDKLRLLADQAAAELRAAGGYHVFDDLGLRMPNIQIDIDQDRANSLGLNNKQIGNVAQASFTGLKVTELREGDRLIPVLIRGRIEDRSEAEKIRGLYVQTPDGKSVPFESFSTLKAQPEFVTIPHYNQLRTVTVKAYAPFGELPSQILDRARAGLAKIKLAPGYELKFAGEDKELRENKAEMGAVMLISLALIALTMVLQFSSVVKSMVVMLTVPLGLIGAVLGLFVTHSPLGFMALLAMVSLAGIMVSHIIVLSDFIEEARAKGLPLEQALVRAGLARLRPVLVTVLATVGGLIPLFLTGGALWHPLTAVHIVGLLLATVLTLVMLPTLYYVFCAKLKFIK
jgi:multidrug efflux pump subunit AcrB